MRKILLSGLIVFLILASISNFVTAPETACTDSDEGIDYYVKGTTTNPPPQYTSYWTDECVTSVTLQEGTCIEGLGVHTYDCPNGCIEGGCVYLDKEDCSPELVEVAVQDADGDGCNAGFDSDCGGIEGVDDPSVTCFNDLDDDCDGMINEADDDLSCNLECGDGVCGWYEKLETSEYYCQEDCGTFSHVKVFAKLDENEWEGPVIFDLSQRSDFDGLDATGLFQVPIEFPETYPEGMNVYIRYREEGGFQSGPEGAYLDRIIASCGENGNPIAGPCPAPVSFTFEFKSVEQECVGEGGSLGAVIPENTKQCCPGLTQISAAKHEGGGACSIMVGSRGYCTYCGDGVCKEPENLCNCPDDCKYSGECPVVIDLAFNKYDYYPGDYFEAVVKIYDENRNLMPNQAFSIYNERQGTGSTYYTDSTGIWKETSRVPSNPEISGEWTFLASVNKEECSYISDKESIFIHITNECGNGFCDNNEKEIVCETVCTSGKVMDYTLTAPALTGSITAVATQVAIEQIEPLPTICETFCHVKCPKDCTPNCGNGVCDKEVCEAEGCPVPENERNCPQDCKQANYCGHRSSDPACVCESGYRKERFQAPCEEEAEAVLPAGSVTGGIVAESECADSDGGKNYYVKGTVRWYVPEYNGFRESEDTCRETEEGNNVYSGKLLIEGTCEGQIGEGALGTALHAIVYECPNGCVNGACIREGEKCAEEGEYTSGPVSPEYQFDCCDGLKGFDTKPGVVGRGLLCYNPDKGYPECKHEGTRSEGWYYAGTEGQLLRYELCSAQRMCTYYRCVPSYKYMYLSTDKYAYNLNERVVVSTNTFEAGTVDREGINVNVKKPYGETESLTLKLVCETGPEMCPSCIAGQYCPPCKTYNVCKYTGTYTGTDTIGNYVVSPTGETTDYTIHSTSFKVYDHSLLEKYLILKDIGGFRYIDAQFYPGPENLMGYMARYQRDIREYGAVVIDFETREDLEKFLEMGFQQNRPYEKGIEGYHVYVLENYGQKVYIWTYKNFLIGVMESLPIAVTTGVVGGYGVAEQIPVKQEVREAIPLQEQEVLGTPEKAPSLLTGMITGMPSAIGTELKYCGMDSLDPNCQCRGDETKEEFTPQCFSPPCEAHYRCRVGDPLDLLKAYLDKYPSDIKAEGTECEQKGGYCTSVCREGFEDTGFACKSTEETCCVKEVDRDDFLEMVMKLEGIRVRMDKLERQANALAEYYDSVGDDDRANKFRAVAGMFGNVKDMVDDIVAKIRANLGDLERIRAEVKNDIRELRSYISGILEKMVS